MPDVVIVGGGPVGLMLACEVALAGIEPLVLERLPERLTTPKANGLVGQVVRLLDHRGLYERIRGRAGAPVPLPSFFFGAVPLTLTGLDANPMFALPIPQRELEGLLAERAAELGAEVRRGHEVRSYTQDDEGVTLQVEADTGMYELRASYLVGCDGGHSTIRHQAGIAFPGVSTDNLVARAANISMPSWASVTADGRLNVRGAGEIQPGFHRTERGVLNFALLDPERPLVNTLEWQDDTSVGEWPGSGAPMTLDELRESIRRVLGVDLPLEPPPPGPAVLRRLIGRNTRLAERYRQGRVFLAGDAAHVHSASGGPGLNLGLQDAANLGWKLAAVVRGWAAPGLLDTYETERHAVGARVFMQTQAQTALMAPGGDVTALRELFGELLRRQENVQYIADLMAGSDVRYDMGDPGADPLTGHFAPELILHTASGTRRLAELMHDGRPMLIDLTGDPVVLDQAVQGWDGRVARITAIADNPPARGLLVRPDGYVAWALAAGEPDKEAADGLRRALSRWFGEPSYTRP
jgi:2-polyprenyl-6-methoxyphenol hydroxylase-like FAD-dependent oxidoreductase